MTERPFDVEEPGAELKTAETRAKAKGLNLRMLGVQFGDRFVQALMNSFAIQTMKTGNLPSTSTMNSRTCSLI